MRRIDLTERVGNVEAVDLLDNLLEGELPLLLPVAEVKVEERECDVVLRAVRLRLRLRPRHTRVGAGESSMRGWGRGGEGEGEGVGVGGRWGR